MKGIENRSSAVDSARYDVRYLDEVLRSMSSLSDTSEFICSLCRSDIAMMGKFMNEFHLPMESRFREKISDVDIRSRLGDCFPTSALNLTSEATAVLVHHQVSEPFLRPN